MDIAVWLFDCTTPSLYPKKPCATFVSGPAIRLAHLNALSASLSGNCGNGCDDAGALDAAEPFPSASAMTEATFAVASPVLPISAMAS
jgi:hypothetical protein